MKKGLRKIRRSIKKVRKKTQSLMTNKKQRRHGVVGQSKDVPETATNGEMLIGLNYCTSGISPFQHSRNKARAYLD
jgi:hypothetical protein